MFLLNDLYKKAHITNVRQQSLVLLSLQFASLC